MIRTKKIASVLVFVLEGQSAQRKTSKSTTTLQWTFLLMTDAVQMLEGGGQPEFTVKRRSISRQKVSQALRTVHKVNKTLTQP